LPERGAEVEIAVVTCLLAKRNMDVNAGQGVDGVTGKLSGGYSVICCRVSIHRYLETNKGTVSVHPAAINY
jgi:hypothetical protein